MCREFVLVLVCLSELVGKAERKCRVARLLGLYYGVSCGGFCEQFGM